jgi:hypothetical protein
MKWQVALSICMGLLIPVPLVLLLFAGMYPEAPGLGGGRISPVLDVEQRTRRLTYHRECRDSSECDAPLGCVSDGRVWAEYCTDSRCMTDLQCPEGLVCRSVGTLGKGPLVRFCIPVGTRGEGARCDPLPSDKEEACGPGLLCGGQDGWCARPCQNNEEKNCPEGFFCADVDPQPVCLPTCETRGCPEGQQCLRHQDGVSTCAMVYGTNCQQSVCPQGLECRMLDSFSQPDKVWMECVQGCGEGAPACPEGLVCYMFRCRAPCDPQVPGACGKGFRCKRVMPERPALCWPDWPE